VAAIDASISLTPAFLVASVISVPPFDMPIKHKEKDVDADGKDEPKDHAFSPRYLTVPLSVSHFCIAHSMW
jgi:hypothetical protein